MCCEIFGRFLRFRAIITKTMIMKRSIFALFLLSGLIFSCSSDKEDPNDTDQNAIVGTWQATELKINNETASDGAKFAKAILDHLTAKNCYILPLTFNADLSIVAENAGNNLEINVNESNTGLDVPCPSEKDTTTSAYTYNGSVLTVSEGGSNPTSINMRIEGNTMYVNASQLNLPNFNAEGELIFKRR